MRVLAIALLVGCGRTDFDNLHDAATAGDPSLIAWYQMDQLVGLDEMDATGNGHTASCAPGQCPGLGVGEIGGSFGFDGMTQSLSVTSDAQLETNTGFTVAGFFKQAVNGTTGCIFSKLYGTADCNSWQLCVFETNELFFFSCDAATSDDMSSVAFPAAGVWHHAAIRWDGITKSLFIDGVLDSADQASIVFDSGELVFGADIDLGVSVSFFAGAIDDVRIYNRALADAEIAALASQ